jgi:hypothetical protein
MLLVDPPPALFTPEFWTALPATIAAVGAILATILSHRKSTKQRQAATRESNLQFQGQNHKLEEIQETANGTLAAALKRITDLEKEILKLKKGE